jgi:hypothetical protein
MSSLSFTEDFIVQTIRMAVAQLPHPDPALKHARYPSEVTKLLGVSKHPIF